MLACIDGAAAYACPCEVVELDVDRGDAAARTSMPTSDGRLAGR